MKLVALFCILVAVAAEPVIKTWTLNELSIALQTNTTDPILRPYLEDALNKIMLALYTNKDLRSIYAALSSPTGTAFWTMAELSNAIEDPSTDSSKRDLLMQWRTVLLRLNESGKPQDSTPVYVPALDVSLWTQEDVNKAIEDTNTSATMMKHLEQASNEFKQALASGKKREKVGMVTTVGVIPMKAGQSEYLPAPPRPELTK